MVIERKRYAIGIILLFVVVIIWVSSSFLTKHIFSQKEYNKPFAITYLNTASFSLYLLAFIFSKKRPVDKQRILEFNHALYDTNSQLSNDSNDSISNHSIKSDDAPEVGNSGNYNLYSTPQSSTFALGLNNDDNSFFMRSPRPTEDYSSIDPHDLLSNVAKLGFKFCMLWFAANWCSNASLAYTTVASSTILASTSGFFTLGIGSLAGVEKFTYVKLLAVFVSVIGVSLISIERPDEGQDNPVDPFFGDFLAILSALFYGSYSVFLKIRIQRESRVNMPLFFGFVGLFNVFLLWPLFILLHLCGFEYFQLPSNGVLLKTGYLIGALLVVSGFLGVNFETLKDGYKFKSLMNEDNIGQDSRQDSRC
ncbi:508_t:CDS:2 [Diversispora eburnea]|uniref:508_t:CDS:1 n=1 Tax=Diversispora eburnea TaxID=1213867 RepID=A0A9N8UXY4_9GLOM|nr:508_t:CDS:2 [Diversispora eburnea]